MDLCLRPSNDWRRAKLFRRPQSTRARSHKSLATCDFKVMSDISSPGAETHSNCVSGETLVNRFANSLDVAGLVKRSTLLTPSIFYGTSRCCGSQQRRTLVLQLSYLVDSHFAQYRDVMSREHCIHMHSVAACDSDDISPIACRSQGEVSRSRQHIGRLALDLRPLIVSVDDVGSA